VIVWLIPLKFARTNPQKGNSISVIGIHIGVNLEDKSREFGFLWKNFTLFCLATFGRWRNFDEGV
jgi:hypothetical protein